MQSIGRSERYLCQNYRHLRTWVGSSNMPTSERMTCKSVLLAEMLHCSHRCALLLMKKNKDLGFTEIKQLQKTALVLKQHFEVRDILKSPRILSLNPMIIEHRYRALLEMGFSTVTTGKILRFKNMLEKTPHYLKIHNLIPSKLDSVDMLLSYITCPDDVKRCIKFKLTPLYTFNHCMLDIRKVIVIEYLIWKLNSSSEKIHKLLLKYPSLATRSFHLLEETIKMLTEEFVLPTSKLIDCGYLLIIHLSNLKSIATEISKLGGCDLKCFSLKYPKILSMPADSLQEVEKCLRDFQINNEQILQCGNVYTLNPSLVKSRLEELCETVGFEVVKSYSRILFLVYHHDSIKEKLRFLRLMGALTVQSFNHVAPIQSFKSGSYGKYYSCNKRPITFLAKLLGKDKAKIKWQLEQHPKSSAVSVYNSKTIVQFLLSNGITKEQIWYGLPIILYNLTVVKNYFESIPYQDTFYSFSEAKNHFNFVQLLLYYIEKDSNFTGNGIYKTERK